MRLRIVVAVLLIVAGGLILAGSLSWSRRNDAVNLGSVRVSTTEKQTIPPWIGGVVAAAGLLLIFAGAGKQR
ncbi:MAG: hypothetical protein ACREK8_01765 [Gemmatimonadales bacterium]